MQHRNQADGATRLAHFDAFVHDLQESVVLGVIVLEPFPEDDPGDDVGDGHGDVVEWVEGLPLVTFEDVRECLDLVHYILNQAGLSHAERS